MINYEPKPYSYKGEVWRPTPEEQEILRRWREEIWKRAREKLRERNGH
jgi:hypothetical protein